MATDITHLFFTRHADAGSSVDYQGPDNERALTEVGVLRTERVAAHIAQGPVRPDVILTSPFVRAAQTAAILAQELEMKDYVRDEALLAPGFNIDDLRQILAHFVGTSRIVLVGHEPDFSIVISQLIGGGTIEMKKGAIARVDITDPVTPAGILKWLAPPVLLVR